MFKPGRSMALFLLASSSITLPACVARTAFDVVTAPVKAVGKAADLATTSQSEADEKRGREIRKREETLGKLERQYEKQRDKCEEGDRDACKEARDIYGEMQALMPSIPVEPENR